MRFYLPLTAATVLLGIYWFFQRNPLVLGTFGDVREVVFGHGERGLLFLSLVALIFFVVRLFDSVAFDLVMSRRGSVVAPQLLREILSIVLYAVLFSWIISAIFHFSITGFLASATVVAAIAGLALQETLGNLFAGIALHLEDTYDVGDVIHSGEFIGVVERVSWRATKIRGFNNQVIVLPNSLVARERVEVFPANNLNARTLSLGIDYHVAPATAISVLAQAAAHVEGVARERPCLARVSSFGDSSVQYEVKYFTRDYASRDRIDAEIRKAIWYSLQRSSISIAYPIRSYQTYTPPKSDHHVITAEEVAVRLQEVDILLPLSEAAHAAIAGATQVHYYSKGEAILQHDAEGHSMFIVHEGTVSVRVPDQTARGWHEVAELGPGALFGEMALLTGATRTADIVALSEVTAFEIGKEALGPILQDHPELALAISNKVMQRRELLNSIRSAGPESEQTVLSRIRSYFGIG